MLPGTFWGPSSHIFLRKAFWCQGIPELSHIKLNNADRQVIQEAVTTLDPWIVAAHDSPFKRVTPKKGKFTNPQNCQLGINYEVKVGQKNHLWVELQYGAPLKVGAGPKNPNEILPHEFLDHLSIYEVLSLGGCQASFDHINQTATPRNVVQHLQLFLVPTVSLLAKIGATFFRKRKVKHKTSTPMRTSRAEGLKPTQNRFDLEVVGNATPPFFIKHNKHGGLVNLLGWWIFSLYTNRIFLVRKASYKTWRPNTSRVSGVVFLDFSPKFPWARWQRLRGVFLMFFSYIFWSCFKSKVYKCIPWKSNQLFFIIWWFMSHKFLSERTTNF